MGFNGHVDNGRFSYRQAFLMQKRVNRLGFSCFSVYLLKMGFIYDGNTDLIPMAMMDSKRVFNV